MARDKTKSIMAAKSFDPVRSMDVVKYVVYSSTCSRVVVLLNANSKVIWDGVLCIPS